MKISINNFPGNYDTKKCYVHARAAAFDENNIIMTMQYLDVTGSDVFEPPVILKSNDGGISWSDPEIKFDYSYSEDGLRHTVCDVTPLHHTKTKTMIMCGHSVAYATNAEIPKLDAVIHTDYFVYDMEKDQCSELKRVCITGNPYPLGCATGCSQFIEEENGDLLIPVYIVKYNRIIDNGKNHEVMYNSAVMRCAFDGRELVFKEMSNELTTSIAGGFCEGSLYKFEGKYYYTLRTIENAYWSVSDDGKNFSEPKVWRWDTGEILPTYNTQQHWLECDDRLHLVYTRKAGNNDHVFRHRAPLFMAEVDTETMCILRHTEQIVVPERGARLGNFGVTQINKNKALITVNEWMQPAGCEKFGSDNSLFVTVVEA